MAVDLPEAHAGALQHTRGYVAAITPDQLGKPSNCEPWDVRGLLNHVVSGNLWVPELVHGKTIEEVGDRLDGDVLGDYPEGVYEMSMTVAAAAFREDGAMDRPVAVSYGPVPGSLYCGHRLLDVLVHGWDLATSTDQDTNLPADLVEATWEVIEPQLDELIASGMFGTRLTPPPGADRQGQLLAALGRAE